MKTHELKTVQPFFERVWIGDKRFEVRNNDRDFQAGDIVNLNEYFPETNSYSGRVVSGDITYVLNGYPAIKKGYVVFSFSVRERLILDKTTEQ